jgi:SAM-dependent MidA family methyltransferase
MRPPEAQSFAVVASEDGESYQLAEWDTSCDVVLGGQSESDIVVEVNFSALAAQEEECGVHIRPFLTTTRHPGVKPAHER